MSSSFPRIRSSFFLLFNSGSLCFPPTRQNQKNMGSPSSSQVSSCQRVVGHRRLKNVEMNDEQPGTWRGSEAEEGGPLVVFSRISCPFLLFFLLLLFFFWGGGSLCFPTCSFFRRPSAQELRDLCSVAPCLRSFPGQSDSIQLTADDAQAKANAIDTHQAFSWLGS